MTSCSWQIHILKPNACCIVWSRKQVTLASMWRQTERSPCVLMRKETSPHYMVDLWNSWTSSCTSEAMSLSIENDSRMRLVKIDTAIDRLSIIWKSELSNKIKCNFFPSSFRVNSTVWMHHIDADSPYREKKLDGNCTRMLRAILNKSWKQHPTKQLLYGHLLPISQII